jgi:hypothetical protein
MPILAPVTNFAAGTLSAGITNLATTFNLTTGHGARFAAPFFATLYDTFYASADLDPNREVVYVGTLIADAASNVVRAQGGTSAVAHNTGGRTYALVAGPQADTLNPRSLTLGSGGPTADVSSGTADWATLLTLPADFLRAGDLLKFRMVYWHKSGAYVYAPRLGLRLGSHDVIPLGTTYWSASEFGSSIEAEVYIQTIGAAGQAFRSGIVRRENGATATLAMDHRVTLNTTAALAVVPHYRFDSAGETINLGFWHVELMRA